MIELEIEREDKNFCKRLYLEKLIREAVRTCRYFVSENTQGYNHNYCIYPLKCEEHVYRTLFEKIIGRSDYITHTDEANIERVLKYKSGFPEIGINVKVSLIEIYVDNDEDFIVIRDNIIPAIDKKLTGTNIKIKITKSYCDYTAEELFADDNIDLSK